MKILVADDDDHSRDWMREVVSHLGHEPVEAVDGKAAWQDFLKHKPTAVISDWMMPGMDGLALCRKIREAPEGSYTYFILLSGKKTSQDNYLTAMNAGVDDFMTKPADIETVRIRLRVAERIGSMASRIGELESFLPVCAYCRRIREENGDYEPLEEYLHKHAKVRFSHGICPECLKKHAPEKS